MPTSTADQTRHPVDLLPLAAAGTLAGDGLAAVTEHTVSCPACAAELDEWRRISSAVRFVGRTGSVRLPSPAADGVNLCARVPRELRARLKTRAVEADRSLQELVIDAVARYLDHTEQE